MKWYIFFFFKQKTAYEMRISDWSSDVCSSDLVPDRRGPVRPLRPRPRGARFRRRPRGDSDLRARRAGRAARIAHRVLVRAALLGAPRRVAAGDSRHRDRPAPADEGLFRRPAVPAQVRRRPRDTRRSEEHTSELQSLMRISYAVF